MANYTDISILLDRSGSMADIKASMESGLKEFIQGHKEVPTTRLTLIQFDDQQPCEELYVERPITDVPEFTLKPRGWTPLLDSLCEAIDRTGARLAAKKESDRPEKVLFLIITDGAENSSRKFRREDVQKRIHTQSNTYKWEFSYLGANQDAYKEAATLGIDYGKTLNFIASAGATTNAWKGLTTNTVAYSANLTSTLVNYTPDQIKSAVKDEVTP